MGGQERRSDARALAALAFTVLANVGAGAWWASNITSRLDQATEAIKTAQATQYTKAEATSDFRNVELQVVEVARRVSNLEEQRRSR